MQKQSKEEQNFAKQIQNDYSKRLVNSIKLIHIYQFDVKMKYSWYSQLLEPFWKRRLTTQSRKAERVPQMDDKISFWIQEMISYLKINAELWRWILYFNYWLKVTFDSQDYLTEFSKWKFWNNLAGVNVWRMMFKSMKYLHIAFTWTKIDLTVKQTNIKSLKFAGKLGV